MFDETRRHLKVIHTLVIQRQHVWWHAKKSHDYLPPRHPETTSPMTRGDTSWLSAPSSFGDGKSDDIGRHLMVTRTLVIRRRKVCWHVVKPDGFLHPRHPKTASPMTRIDQYGHLLPFLETSGSFDRDYFRLTLVIRRRQVQWNTETPQGYSHPHHPEMTSLMTCGDTSWLSIPSLFRDVKSNDTQRHLMVIHTLVIWRRQVRWHAETPHGYLHCHHPKMASPMTCGDTSWLSGPSSSGDGKSDSMGRHLMVIRTLVIRRQQVRWHVETPYGYPHPRHSETTSWWHTKTNMVICSLCRRPQGLSTKTTLVSPSSSEDGKSDDTRRHLKVIRTLVIRRGQVRWHTETNIVVCFPRRKTQLLSIKATEVSPAIPRQVSPIACGDGTWCHFHQGFCNGTWCLLCSFFWQVSLIELLVGRVGI